MAINYELKARVLSDYPEVIALQRKASLLSYLKSQGCDVDPAYYEAVYDTVFSFFEDDEAKAIYREAEKINLAYYARVKRLKNRIAAMLLSGQCYFLTLTFTDDVLQSTTDKTRRRYVTRFLKSQSDIYCANIDYGTQNGREHYHAVVKADTIDMTPWDKLGFSNAKKIASADDYAPIAKYISKLTNHAIKATTRGTRAIYNN